MWGGQTEQDTQGEPPSAEAAAFISCDNKLPPSVPCTQKSRREPWHIPSGAGLGIGHHIYRFPSEQPVPRSGNGCLFQKDNGIRPVKKPGHTRRAKGSFHGQQEQGLSRKTPDSSLGQRHPVLFWHLPKEAQAVWHTDKHDWEVWPLRKRCCGTCQWHTQTGIPARESESRYPTDEECCKDAISIYNSKGHIAPAKCWLQCKCTRNVMSE